MGRSHILVALLLGIVGSALLASAQERSSASSPSGASGASYVPSASHARSRASASEESAMRIEGERRFRTNCGRCHMAPHKFPPRIMATAIRHMRVRSLITDEDMRLILQYMTQ